MLHRWCFFNKLKARPTASKSIRTRLIAILALLRWSRIEPAISLSCACIKKMGGPLQASHRASGAEHLNSNPGTVLTPCDLGQVTCFSEPVSFSEKVTTSQNHCEDSTRTLHKVLHTTLVLPPSPPPECNQHFQRMSAEGRASRSFSRCPLAPPGLGSQISIPP